MRLTLNLTWDYSLLWHLVVVWRNCKPWDRPRKIWFLTLIQHLFFMVLEYVHELLVLLIGASNRCGSLALRHIGGDLLLLLLLLFPPNSKSLLTVWAKEFLGVFRNYSNLWLLCLKFRMLRRTRWHISFSSTYGALSIILLLCAFYSMALMMVMSISPSFPFLDEDLV